MLAASAFHRAPSGIRLSADPDSTHAVMPSISMIFSLAGISRAASRAGLAALLVLSGSCVDSREEYWIDSRGAGRAEINVSLPAAALSLLGGDAGVNGMIESFARGVQGVELSSSSVSVAEERAHVRVAFKFKSALDLADLADAPALAELPAAARHLLGKVEVSIRGREISYHRMSTPGRAFPLVALMPSSQLKGHWLTIMHLPAAARESNATRIENSGRTLVWETSLATVAKSPVITRFTMDAPIPWTRVLSVGLPIALACGFFLIRKSSRASPDESAGHDR